MLSLSVFITGLVGEVLTIWSLLSSIFELHALLARRLNGSKKLAGVSNIMRDAFSAVIQGIVIYVGYSAFLSGDGGMYSRCWVVTSMLLTLNLVVDRVRRIRVERLFQEEERRQQFGRRSTDFVP